MTPAKNAPLAACLASDSASNVTGQVFAVRHNGIFLFDPFTPIRSVHRSEGWDIESIQQQALPALESNFAPLTRSADIFNWDPV